MPGSLRDLIEDVYRKQGELTPHGLVKVARNPKHPLHSHFTWDEHENSEKYLLLRAAELIRSVKIRYVDIPEPRSVRAYHIVRTLEGTSSYQPTETVVGDPMKKAILLRQMEREWHEFRRRWEHMEEFAALIAGGGEGGAAQAV